MPDHFSTSRLQISRVSTSLVYHDNTPIMKSKRNRSRSPSLHHLYEASVQDTESELTLFTRWFRKKTGRPMRTLREDFSGTGAFACDFVARHRENRGWAVDLDRDTLLWGKAFHGASLGEDLERMQFVHGDVRTAETPTVDHINALNFSYSLFKTRPDLTAYFRACRKRLRPDGLFIVDVFGGTESQQVKQDRREVPACRLKDGTRLKAFTYYWAQQSFNPVTFDMTCAIHFKYPGLKKMKNAFTYDWRLWTLPEVRELMEEAGFNTEVYIHGFDADGDSDEIYRKRTRYENTEGWVAYIVGQPARSR